MSGKKKIGFHPLLYADGDESSVDNNEEYVELSDSNVREPMAERVKIVEVPTEKIKIVEKPVDRIVEKPVVRTKVVEVPVERVKIVKIPATLDDSDKELLENGLSRINAVAESLNRMIERNELEINNIRETVIGKMSNDNSDMIDGFKNEISALRNDVKKIASQNTGDEMTALKEEVVSMMSHGDIKEEIVSAVKDEIKKEFTRMQNTANLNQIEVNSQIDAISSKVDNVNELREVLDLIATRLNEIKKGQGENDFDSVKDFIETQIKTQITEYSKVISTKLIEVLKETTGDVLDNRVNSALQEAFTSNIEDMKLTLAESIKENLEAKFSVNVPESVNETVAEAVKESVSGNINVFIEAAFEKEVAKILKGVRSANKKLKEELSLQMSSIDMGDENIEIYNNLKQEASELNVRLSNLENIAILAEVLKSRKITKMDSTMPKWAETEKSGIRERLNTIRKQVVDIQIVAALKRKPLQAKEMELMIDAPPNQMHDRLAAMVRAKRVIKERDGRFVVYSLVE